MSEHHRRDLLKGVAALPLLWTGAAATAAERVPAHLKGELDAERVLNGDYPYPPSPKVAAGQDRRGQRADRLVPPPAAGQHPRLLFTQAEIPEIRRRWQGTETGRHLLNAARQKVETALAKPDSLGKAFYDALSAGDLTAAQALVKSRGFPPPVGHYKPWIYGVVLQALIACIEGDTTTGTRAATALATYAGLIAPDIEQALSEPMNDDVWRVKLSGSLTGASRSGQGMRDVLAYQLLGYGYDFAHGFMTEAQREILRALIARVTYGRLWEGARLPHHFRNWNHVMVALQQPLLALAIEGEAGYDPRVYRLGVQIARDYLDYAFTENGVSTEAIGYIQFGFVWGMPFMVAADRRGEGLLSHAHHRAALDWYLHCETPGADAYISRGDGGDTGPALWTLAAWLYHFPDDPRVQALWAHQYGLSGVDNQTKTKRLNAFYGDVHLIEALIWAEEIGTPVPLDPARPVTLYDRTRGSLNTRTDWSDTAAFLTFENRLDSVGSSHEHADRGAFTFAALGKVWAKDNFRSPETRHHNSVLIDGKGQGYWPGPGEWLRVTETPDAITALCSHKAAYDWAWPKQILTEPAHSELFRYERWQDYAAQAARFREQYRGIPLQRDTRPSVTAFWSGFERGDPRQWDEDGWPVRYAFNPVQKAFRSLYFRKGPSPWLIIADEIQKDNSERLYEWLMQTGPEVDLIELAGNDMVLIDTSGQRAKGSAPRLLVRVLAMNEPQRAIDYTTRPSFRLETFERRDTLEAQSEVNALAGSRSFGLDKRLVIASRSRAPGFRVLLFPLAPGQAKPKTVWEDRDRLRLEASGAEPVRLAFDTSASFCDIRQIGGDGR
ncbi:hypothetical protein PQU94_05315 [Asticcacaulis sp. DXS10W]|uniref:Uncharacterized protein n=1 Tax=Asticcacaulis currens TaxID=2984210 RepID=A0ABT5IC24_9CAUL|nr:hypothetical protein [Asticcacaulis currens]MDC7693698.1 hypothetical protein [Asticcacaulis currens]